MQIDELSRKRLRELALRAKHGRQASFTRFLEPPMENEVLRAANEAELKAAFFGGFDGAERRIAAFYEGDAPQGEEYPLVCLLLRWNSRYAQPSHRDLLGAVMGLGLERSAIGDIAPSEEDGCAYLFVHRDVESYICANLESAGRAKLKIAPLSGEMRIKAPEGDESRITVSSPRLDAVLAAGLRLSRGEAQRLIEAGLVKRNHIPELRSDAHLEEGDLLSVRGFGRLRLRSVEGETRRGRLALRLFKYKG